MSELLLGKRVGNRRAIPMDGFLASVCDTAGMSAAEFESIRQLAYNRFGLDLKPGKQALVSARLNRILRAKGFGTFSEYHAHVVRDRSGEALTEMIDALTTNHTAFWREPAHFDILQTVVREEFPSGPLRLWSAACASGEEPYTMAMCLVAAGIPLSRFSVLATDISTRALAAGRRGVYARERLTAAPPLLRKVFLKPLRNVSPDLEKVRPDIAARVEFRRLNLVETFESIGRFHVIFCRNVMIYFDRTTQAALVSRLAAALEPGGYLFVGHSESLSGMQEGLTFREAAVYKRTLPNRRALA